MQHQRRSPPMLADLSLVFRQRGASPSGSPSPSTSWRRRSTTRARRALAEISSEPVAAISRAGASIALITVGWARVSCRDIGFSGASPMIARREWPDKRRQSTDRAVGPAHGEPGGIVTLR